MKGKLKARKRLKMRKRKKRIVELPEAVKSAKLRRCIDIAIPFHKLWICNLGRTRIAFIKGHRNLPLGVIVRKKKGKHEYLVSVKPFDSTEHERLAAHLCFPRRGYHTLLAST